MLDVKQEQMPFRFLTETRVDLYETLWELKMKLIRWCKNHGNKISQQSKRVVCNWYTTFSKGKIQNTVKFNNCYRQEEFFFLL